MGRAFLVLASLFAFSGVALGAFGAHALQGKVPAERLGAFETGVRYQLYHAFGLFAVVLVRSIAPLGGRWYTLVAGGPGGNLPSLLAGWLFVAGIVLFSGSLYLLTVTGVRKWGMVTPLGGLCFLAGWLALAWGSVVAL